ncbi:PLD nuclease N-terminal domain-containing protein [Paenibacillus sp. FSL R10-2771]|uniref:PLD nuclease N-terminal domain-containing protein n=1 Tax=Paenibacillus sp. FSL R10-2771 TaxID=2954693 RepID=UPI004046A05C
MEGVRMDKVNWGLIAPLLALQILLAVVGLISLARTEQVRGPKWMWVLLLVFGNLLGSIAYFTLGRKEL